MKCILDALLVLTKQGLPALSTFSPIRGSPNPAFIGQTGCAT